MPSASSADPPHEGGHGELALRAGDVVAGKYRVEHVLGVGGMGGVVAATHIQLQQRVAIKFLLPRSLKNPTVVARFEREARAAVRLRSEHVARVIDVGAMESGAPFMVMEYLDGQDLDQIVEARGPLPASLAIDYVLQASEALAEAHALGIVHRDLKPQNLFVTRRVDGRPLVKVLDFGISKGASDKEELALTGTGDVMGSPHYMSPEQLRGARDVDARSDLWALGAVLHTLLSGTVPFDGENMGQLCARILVDEPASLRQLVHDLPAGLEAVVLRCLRKDPAQRFADIAELARALDPYAHHDATRAADRVVGASGRPPPLTATPVVVPSLSLSRAPTVPLASGAIATSTADGWTGSDVKPPRGRALYFGVLVLVVVVVLGAGAAALVRDRLKAPVVATRSVTTEPSATATPATTPATAPATNKPAAAEPDDTPVDTPVDTPADAGAVVRVEALSPAPPTSATSPLHKKAPAITPRRPTHPLKPPPAVKPQPEQADDAPDLRQ